MSAATPVCRRCNYPVAGLPTLICPECGGDLRQVGIRLPGEPRFPGIAGPLFASALLAFIPTLFIAISLSGTVEHITVTNSSGFAPLWYERQTNPVQSLTISCSGSGTIWFWGPTRYRDPVQTIAFQITVFQHSPSTFQADMHGNCWIGNAPPHPINSSAVLAWLAQAGLNPAAPQTHEIAGDIVASIPEIHFGGIQAVGFTDLQGNSSSSSGSGYRPNGFLGILWLFAGLIWAILAWRIWRLHEHPLCGTPTCGRCGFDASQFTDFTCPRCGSDAREDGICVSERHPWSGLASPLLVSGILALVTAGVVGSILEQTYRQSNMARSVMFVPQYDFHIRPIIESVWISAAASHLVEKDGNNSSNFTPDQIMLSFQIKGHRPLTSSLNSDATWTYLAPDGTVVDRPWTRPAVLEMLQTAGLNPSDQITQQLATDTLAGIAQCRAGQFDKIHFTGLGGGGGSSSSSSGDAAWLSNLQWPVWLLIWVIAVCLIFRVQKRRRQKNLALSL